jgi:hypothetical protein
LLSQATTIKAATVPSAPNAPTLVNQNVDRIEIAWTAPYDGLDPIYDYKVLWDSGNGNSIFTELVSSTAGQITYNANTGL